MQGHPTGKNNPCRPAPNNLFQPSPIKPWPRTNQVIGRMMDSLHIKDNREDVDADNELDDLDTSYECPSASSSSSDESATSTSTLVNPNKRRTVPCTPPPPSKRAATSVPRSRRSVSTDIDIELVPPASHSSDRSFFLDSPFHHIPYPPNPIPTEPPFVIPDTGEWNRVNPNHKHPTNNAQLAGHPSTSSSSSLQRAGSARPTEFVPSPVRVPVRRTRRTSLSAVVLDAPEVQMLQLPPSHPEKFWGTECPTERAGSESRVSTPAPLMPAALSSARSRVSVATTSKKQYLEVPPRVLSRFGSVPLDEQEKHAHRSAYDDDGGDERALVVLATVPVPTSVLTLTRPDHIYTPFERYSEAPSALATREITKTLLQELLGGLTTWTGFKLAALYFFIPLFLIFFAADLAADWVKENWLS